MQPTQLPVPESHRTWADREICSGVNCSQLHRTSSRSARLWQGAVQLVHGL